MRKVLLLVGLSMMAVLMFAPAALAEHRYGCPHDKPFVATAPGDPGEGSLRCFATQAEADLYSETGSTASPTPTATSGCTTTTDPETGESVTTCVDTAPPTATGTPTPTSTVTSTPTATNAAEAQYGGGKEVVLPETGGAGGFALLAGALLVGGGVMSFALFRRS